MDYREDIFLCRFCGTLVEDFETVFYVSKPIQNCICKDCWNLFNRDEKIDLIKFGVIKDLLMDKKKNYFNIKKGVVL